jgi:hypothetical protein
MKSSYKLYILLAFIITVSMVAISSQVGAAPLADPCTVANTSAWIINGQGTPVDGGWTNVSGYVNFAMGFPDVVMQYGDYWVVNSTSYGAQPSSWFHAYVVDTDGVSYSVVVGPGAVNYHFGWAGSPTAGYLPVPDAAYGKHLAYLQIQSGSYGTGSVFVGGGACATATPVTAPIATDMPQGDLPCIAATVAATSTLQATMTPYGRATATPAPTRTPGGPSPTPTASATPFSYTAHAVNSYDSGLITFDQNVSALSAVGHVNVDDQPFKFLRWDSATGYDGHPGVAYMHTWGSYGTVTASVMASDSGLAVFYKPGGELTGPVAVSLYARTAYTLETGGVHFMRVWYLDPNYDGNGTAYWVTAWSDYTYSVNQIGPTVGGLQLSNTWRKFGAVISPTAGSGRIAAIGFDDYSSDLVYQGPSPNAPCPDYGCVYLDDVRIAYGDAVGMVLPICNADGTSGVAGHPTKYKMCIINATPVDMFATCTAPTGIDLGGWLSYLWCNISHYFGFYTANRDQIDAIIARQSVNEPFGSMSETGYIAEDFNLKIDLLKADNKTQVQTPIDWATMMIDGSALDRPAHFTVPDVSTTQAYLANCPSDAMFSSSTTAGACMALYMMRQTFIVTFFQWGLNALFVVGILMLIRGDLEKLAS